MLENTLIPISIALTLLGSAILSRLLAGDRERLTAALLVAAFLVGTMGTGLALYLAGVSLGSVALVPLAGVGVFLVFVVAPGLTEFGQRPEW